YSANWPGAAPFAAGHSRCLTSHVGRLIFLYVRVGAGCEEVVEAAGDWPCPVGGVGDHRVCDAGMRVVDAAEGDAGVEPFQHDGVARRAQPEAEAVAKGLGRCVATRP